MEETHAPIRAPLFPDGAERIERQHPACACGGGRRQANRVDASKEFSGQPAVKVRTLRDKSSRLFRVFVDFHRLLCAAGCAPLDIWDPLSNTCKAARLRSPKLVRRVTEAGKGHPRRACLDDVTADGQRFLMVQRVESTGKPVTRLVLVQNWFDELKRLVPLH